MNAEERAWLYETAEAATPGPWELEAAEVWTAEFGHLVAVASRLTDAEYLAAASPDVVRELIDTLNAAEAERDRLAAAVERVRALHSPINRWPTGLRCAHCVKDSAGHPVPVDHPCPTLRALDGGE